MTAARRAAGVVTAAAALAWTAGSASATWSILIADTRTGEVGLASATCVTGIDLRAETPVLVVGVGGVTAQSAVDGTGQNKVFARDGLLAGWTPAEILAGLAAFDGGHQTRQYGIVDVRGGTATFSGTAAADWAGGVTGTDGDLVYAVQGNILTGPNVVDDAVAAILGTPGDIAEKLMAAMEAARAAGGDGRCSCSNDDPTGCGSPPPEPFKSADVGYMLVARAGDLDACHGVYRAGGRPADVLVRDVDGDGAADEVIAAGPTQVWVYANATADGSVLLRLTERQRIAAPARGLVLADVTGDGAEDLVFATADARVGVAAGLAAGGFAEPVFVAGPADATAVAAADLVPGGAAEVVVSGGSSGTVWAFAADGLGGLVELARFAAGGRVLDVSAAAVDGAGVVVAALPDTDELRVLRGDGAGGVVLAESIAVGNRPVDVLAVDLDNDGIDEVLSANDLDTVVSVARRSAGAWSVSSVATTTRPTALVAADADGDGDADVLANRLTNNNMLVLRNDAGVLSAAQQFATDGSTGRLAATDLNGDGLDDLIATSRNVDGVELVPAVGGGAFDASAGCAGGDYFLALNEARRIRPQPDPVVLLRQKFDAWRAGLAGVPDAVASVVEGGRVVTTTESRVLTVRLKDFAGGAAVSSGLTAEAQGDAVRVEGVRDLGGGVWEVEVAGTRASGRGADVALRIVATGAGGGAGAAGPVELMPAVVVRSRFSLADADGDGLLTFGDAAVFVEAFGAGEASADLDGDGTVGPGDVAAFVDAFAG